MSTFRHTSKGRPSQRTLDARQSLEHDYEEASAWGWLIAMFRNLKGDAELTLNEVDHGVMVVDIERAHQTRAEWLNARAAELERTGAADASEGSLFAQQRESEDRAI